MHPTRNDVMRLINSRPTLTQEINPKKISEYFGSFTFNQKEMEKRLSKGAIQILEKCKEGKENLDPQTAQEVADAVKEWAVEKGVTHFTHWFQPLTESTAEKHDAFLSRDSKGKVLEKFSASQLIQSEPDASSFPSGGVRSTFEARGYTAWDLSSPIFIVETLGARILCIPSVFVSYTGHSLDTKMGLLKSMKTLSSTAVQFLKEIGEKKVEAVNCTIGCEQEYFLIDRAYYRLRPDLIMSGRTLQGSSMARDQQLEDHYFGSIPMRVQAFMADLETELYKLGIPCKTRHNEVAPSQFEIAPIFEEANVAADHNMLMMEVLRRTSYKHNFKCLLHEKPFAGINGSGKHNNWSIATDDGDNLLEPGDTPAANIRFLAVLSCVLKAVFDQQVGLRAAIASHGNDHRLGANEAPPAIISVFLGDTLTKIIDAIENEKDLKSVPAEKAIMDFGLNELPKLPKDNTDRNRTSPFAFTGNKFEFRAVGSSQSISFPATVLNAGVTLTMQEFVRRLNDKKASAASLESAILAVAKEFVTESKAIRFEGNGYSEEWKAEAKKRGLYELLNTAEALEAFSKTENHKFIFETGIYSEEELQSIINVRAERYCKHLAIEARTLATMTQQMIVPAAVTYAQQLKAAEMLTDVYASVKTKVESAYKEATALNAAVQEAESVHDEIAQTKAFATKIAPAMLALREICDSIEDIVPDELWPLPRYREMLMVR